MRTIAVLSLLLLAGSVRAADPADAAIELETKTGKLHGTLDLPAGAGPFPVVVLIAGSGPTDRDGNQPLMKNDSLKLLGQGLAAQGVAVLRFDKRAIGKSAAAGVKEADLRFDMYVADVVDWIALLRKDKRFKRVGVVGHSEGSLIGMLAAKQAKADAFVSLAGAGRSAPEVLREQLNKNLPDGLKKPAMQTIDELAAGRTVADPPILLAALFRPSVQPYLISWFKYDPARELAALEMPVLLVQGSTDMQITSADAKRLAEAKKDARLVEIEGMNHVLKRAATPAEQTKAYSDPSLPLAPELLKELVPFLNDKLKQR